MLWLHEVRRVAGAVVRTAMLGTAWLAGCVDLSGQDKPYGAHSDSTGGDDSSHSVPPSDSGGEETGDCERSTWYTDADSDGYGDPETRTWACEQPAGTVSNARDCDDTNASVAPGAKEVCEDGVVNDCDDEYGEVAWSLCVTSSTLTLDGADGKLVGEDEGDNAGSWVDGLMDMNGDGRTDLLVSATGTEAGAVYVVHGPVTGVVDLSMAAGALIGESEDNPAMGDIGSAGDVNADDHEDVLVGALYPGREGVYLVLGPISGEESLAEADALWAISESDREREHWGAGISVATVGDPNSDGWSDFLLGAPYADVSGAESVVGGCAAAEADGEGDEEGIRAGIVYVVLGPSSGTHTLSGADASIHGEDGGDLAGYAAANPGDLDGDGLDDMVIGAPAQCTAGHGAGAAYVVSSPVEGDLSLDAADAKVIAEHSGDGVGMEVSGAGDVNADGDRDVLMAASQPEDPSGDEGRGMVHLLAGPLTGASSLRDAIAVIYGEDEQGYLGESATSAGDVDLDGFGDILVTAWRSDAGAPDTGAAWLLFGPLSGTHPLTVGLELAGPEEGDEVGLQALGVGDTNADGWPDLLIGATGDDDGGMEAGAAYVLLGGGTILGSLGSW